MRKPISRLLPRLKILPVLMVVATLAFVVRIGDAALAYKSLTGQAVAEETTSTEKNKEADKAVQATDASAAAMGTQPSTDHLKPSAEAEKESGEGKDKEDIKNGDAGAADVTLPSMDQESDQVWQDAKDLDGVSSEIKAEMFKELADRRRQLDEREKSLGEREALLEAAQKEIDRKYKEMTGMRDEIQALLKKQSAEEEAQLASLVKIYSSMKPKDAGRIFNTLDLDILVEVVGKMPENKVSPILAAMDADRVRALTTLLAERKKLPEVPQ